MQSRAVPFLSFIYGLQYHICKLDTKYVIMSSTLFISFELLIIDETKVDEVPFFSFYSSTLLMPKVIITVFASLLHPSPLQSNDIVPVLRSYLNLTELKPNQISRCRWIIIVGLNLLTNHLYR